MESLSKPSQENVIAKSESGSTLEVVKPGEKLKLSPEKKAEIPEKIKEAKVKYEEKVAEIEKKYENSGKEDIDEKIKSIGLQRAKESHDSKIKFLNSLK